MDEVRVDEKNVLDEGEAVLQGNVRISDDVIIELAKKTIAGISNIRLASMGLVSKFGIGRKTGDGIRVLSVEDGKIPATTVDVYIRTKYGYRIPDLVWDVQEKVKSDLERYTGYIVTAVNVNVQGIYADEPKDLSEETPKEEESAACDKAPCEKAPCGKAPAEEE